MLLHRMRTTDTGVSYHIMERHLGYKLNIQDLIMVYYVCVPGVNNFMSVSYVNDSSVSVLWMGSNVMYYLDTEIVPVTGMVM